MEMDSGKETEAGRAEPSRVAGPVPGVPQAVGGRLCCFMLSGTSASRPSCLVSQEPRMSQDSPKKLQMFTGMSYGPPEGPSLIHNQNDRLRNQLTVPPRCILRGLQGGKLSLHGLPGPSARPPAVTRALLCYRILRDSAPCFSGPEPVPATVRHADTHTRLGHHPRSSGSPAGGPS